MLNKLGRISKQFIKVFVECISAWFFLGCPMPTTQEDKIKFLFAVVIAFYMAYTNHDFTEISEKFTKMMRKEKLNG